MRKPNRYGTVYKLGGKRRKPYIARAYTGKDEYGKAIYKTIGYYESKSKANTELEKYNESPYDIDARKLTFKEVFNLYFNEHKKDISESRQKDIISKFNILQSFHKEIFIKLRPVHYQLFFDEYGKTHKKGTLSTIKSLIKQIYKFAIMNDISVKNYGDGIVLRGINGSEQNFFTDLEVEKIKKAAGKVEGADILLFMCFTGIRPQELFNITKFNIDFEKGLITGVGVKTDAGKNKKIVILDIFKPYLKEKYDKATDYIFTTKNGKKLTYMNFLETIYKPLLNELNLAYKSPKACRHYFATLANQKGIDSKALQTAMGHTDINLTKKVYTHVPNEFLNKEIKKIEK